MLHRNFSNKPAISSGRNTNLSATQALANTGVITFPPTP